MQAQRIFVAGHFNVADLILGLRPFPRLAFKFATQPFKEGRSNPRLLRAQGPATPVALRRGAAFVETIEDSLAARCVVGA
jgi:hypothetical protein